MTDPETTVWVAPATQEQLAEGLFSFLVSLAAGRAEVKGPLLPEPATLQDLCRKPPPELVEALRRFLAVSLLRIAPRLTDEVAFDLDAAVWGWVLAVHNVLTPPLVATSSEGDAQDPAAPFLRALIASLAPVRSPAAMLAYYALLEVPAGRFGALPPERIAAVRGLLLRGPLSAVAHLDVHTPPALLGLLEEVLPGAEARIEPTPGYELDDDPHDWLETLLPLAAMPGLATHLRQRWLEMPETRASCRNLGLVLEALRRRGWRDFVLEFYEAYDYLASRANGPDPRWPVLETIGQLLAAGGGSEAAFRVHQWGGAYLLKFRPLVEIIRAEGGVPRDFRFLSRELATALSPLVHGIPESVAVAVEFRD